MQRTACCVARLHAVPVPDTLLGSQPQVWTKISLLMKTVNGVYKDTQKTERLAWYYRKIGIVVCQICNAPSSVPCNIKSIPVLLYLPSRIGSCKMEAIYFTRDYSYVIECILHLSSLCVLL